MMQAYLQVLLNMVTQSLWETKYLFGISTSKRKRKKPELERRRSFSVIQAWQSFGQPSEGTGVSTAHQSTPLWAEMAGLLHPTGPLHPCLTQLVGTCCPWEENGLRQGSSQQLRLTLNMGCQLEATCWPHFSQLPASPYQYLIGKFSILSA